MAATVLLVLAWWRGGGAPAPRAWARSFGRAPRLWLLVYGGLLAAAIPAAQVGAARFQPPAEFEVDAVCYADLRLYLYPDLGAAHYNREWPASRERPPPQPPGAARSLRVPAGQILRLRILTLRADGEDLRDWLGLDRPALPRIAEELRLRFAEPGDYRGFCRRACPGVSAESPLAVRALAPDEYQNWRRQAAGSAPPGWADAGLEALMRDGERVYRRRCAACHGEDGRGSGGLFPGLRGSAMLRGALEGHLSFVWFGRPGSPMKAFGDELSLYEMAAVTTYQRNAWGQGAGDRVQAADVQAVIGAAGR